MKRIIANYTILPHRGIFINHVTTLDDNGLLVDIRHVEDELAYTRYMPGTICILPVGYKHLMEDPQLQGLSREQLYLRLTKIIPVTDFQGPMEVGQCR